MKERSVAGFSYIDVMIAIVILMVGILALLSAITTSVVQSRGQAEQLSAKQIATTTMESIMSVKETDAVRMGWPKVGNVGSNPDAGGVAQGIFLTGRNVVLTNPGPDEVVGTADDTGAMIPGFQREVVITDICDTERPSYNCPTPGTLPVKMRYVEVTITYFVGSIQNRERVKTILTDYSITD